jgi:hypothetical protein
VAGGEELDHDTWPGTNRARELLRPFRCDRNPSIAAK